MVVPAKDEARRIGRCLRALSTAAARDGRPLLVALVLDRCTDATRTVAEDYADGLDLLVLDGPGEGPGPARALGLRALREALGPTALLCSTDADSTVAPDWLLAQRAALAPAAAAAACAARGSTGVLGAVGGRIVLDPDEAAALPSHVLGARATEARVRLASVRGHTPAAEHHQFSGASYALTAAAYDRLGGVPAPAALEDEALERALRAAGIPITYAAGVRVTTSARTDGRVARGLAQVLRTSVWAATATGTATGAADPPSYRIVLAPAGARGDAVHAARAPTIAAARDDAGAAASAPTVTATHDDAGTLEASAPATVLVVLPAGHPDPEQAARVLAAPLADPELHLVRAAPRAAAAHPLAETVARPLLNLHAPDLAALADPLTPAWAIRAATLAALTLPAGDAVDLTVAVDVAARHGLAAIAEVSLDVPGGAQGDGGGAAAYALMAAVSARSPARPVPSSGYRTPAGTVRVALDEHAPASARRPDGAAAAGAPLL